jgi:hypothetical protein
MNKVMKFTAKQLFKNTFQFKNKMTHTYVVQLHTFNKSKKSFCTLNKLDVDILALDKLDDKPININKLEDVTDFNKEDNIIEFGPETKWEETVLSSEIPVVVDCYAK